ncbi:hypothetical protein Bca52824_054180 [Brassica carinata]|uniref:Uncharacterized protein n=1 Tax=Brassica carinata TaxID=52824 RepID=A0A8X7UK98_BRACI|nr:hypothetical protein Bca52824_054180 [Brassica carinata]
MVLQKKKKKKERKKKKSVEGQSEPAEGAETCEIVTEKGSPRDAADRRVVDSDNSPSISLKKKKTARSHESSTPAASASASAAKISPAAPRTLVEGGSASEDRRVKFHDRVEFKYVGETPLSFAPTDCAELVRQIKGGRKDLPAVKDLIFKDASSQGDHANEGSVEPTGRELGELLLQEGGIVGEVVRLEDTTVASASDPTTLSTSLVANEDPLVPVVETETEPVNLLELSDSSTEEEGGEQLEKTESGLVGDPQNEEGAVDGNDNLPVQPADVIGEASDQLTAQVVEGGSDHVVY